MRLNVNGRPREYSGNPFKRLIDVLREDLGLTGTKEGCGEGECGACTVVVGGRTVNSCLVPAGQVEGKRIETIESVGSPERLAPMQAAFLEKGGAQCGICTPGMILSAEAWRKAPGSKTEAGCRQALAGNLCRCTGYQPIVDSVMAAVKGERTARAKPRRKTGGRNARRPLRDKRSGDAARGERRARRPLRDKRSGDAARGERRARR